MYFHVYLIYRFTRTFTDHSSVITRCWGFELQNGKSSLKSPQTLAAQDFAPASFLLNDPTQFEQVDETCEFGGAVLYSESLGITAFFENAVSSKYETQKLKQLQFGIENEKIRQFEHECLIRLFQWSFLPPGKALDFSVCDEAFGCYKTQYRKRHLLEICQNASFLSTPDTSEQTSYRLLRLFYKSQSALILLLLLSKSQPLALGCDLILGANPKSVASIRLRGSTSE